MLEGEHLPSRTTPRKAPSEERRGRQASGASHTDSAGLRSMLRRTPLSACSGLLALALVEALVEEVDLDHAPRPLLDVLDQP
eukprot:15474005-Alexandrium_andersonii.AAC.1